MFPTVISLWYYLQVDDSIAPDVDAAVDETVRYCRSEGV
jgi:hypothetical protein